jgi:signal peptidase I
MNPQHRDRLEFEAEPPASAPSVPGASAPEKPAKPSRPSPRHYQPRRDEIEARRLRTLREILETIALTILLFLGFRMAFQNYRVDGFSMQPTLHDQEYILVNRAAYLFQPPQRGDIIIFAYPLDPSQDYVKRVIGIPGDRVQVSQNGVVAVNGVQLQESYVNDLINPYQPTDIKLGPDQYFVLGDNRGDSSDSRAWGPVPRKNIIGKAWLVYWPLGDFHFVPDAHKIFSALSP